jgi:DnaK suppressor protein
MDLSTQNHLTVLRQALEGRQRELRAEVHAAEQARRAVPADAAAEVIDRKDRSSDNERAELDEAQEERDVRELALVDTALERLHDGRYGDCERCGEAIPFARLLVQPATLHCTACQATIEAQR